MKAKSIFFSLLLMVFMASGSSAAARVIKETKETWSCERTVGATTPICFKNKTGPLRVETWDKNSVKVDISISIDGDDDQVKKIMDYIKAITFQQSGDTVVFNTRFWKSISSGSGISIQNFHIIPNLVHVTLLNCEVVTLRKLDLSFVLTMPKDNPFSLTQAYENVTLPDLNGKINLDLYESNMVAGKLPNCQSMVAKYGKLTIDSVRDAIFTLYESTLKLSHSGNLTIDSKYSETDIGSAGKMSINSYEDKMHILRHGVLGVKGKYTNFTLGDFSKGAFDLYECVLTAGNSDVVAMTAKYCTIKFISCKGAAITSYENKFSFDRVGDLKAGSSYSSFNVTQLDGSLIMTGSHEDKVSVMQVGKTFTGIELVCKYSSVDLVFEPGTAYKLDADLKYSSCNFPKSSFREIRYHKEDEIFQYQGVTPGGDENIVPVVKVQMYEGGIKLK